ncbi:MAG: hypothetical protein ABI183_14220, partial [Polyangiaceae bacterium]
QRSKSRATRRRLDEPQKSRCQTSDAPEDLAFAETDLEKASRKNQFAGGVAALPEHEPLLEQDAFVPSVDAGAAEPAGAAPFALQDAFAPAAAGSVAAGGVLPPQPASTPNMIPDAAETARTLPIFILEFLLVN